MKKLTKRQKLLRAKKRKEEEEAVNAMRSAINQLVGEHFSRKIDAKRRRSFVRDFDDMLAQVAVPVGK